MDWQLGAGAAYTGLPFLPPVETPVEMLPARSSPRRQLMHTPMKLDYARRKEAESDQL